MKFRLRSESPARPGLRFITRCALIIALSVSRASAQQTASDGNGDPLPPVPPEVVSRGENGRVIVRAVRAVEPLRIDGRLDEEVYQSVNSIGGFVQTVPDEGAPVSERTEAWILYDDDNMYVSCRCWDSAPSDEWVANEMRRDSQQLRAQRHCSACRSIRFTIVATRSSSIRTPLGAFSDQVFTDEGNPNREWNPVWNVRAGRFDGGWTVEMAIPFKALRYTSGNGADLGRAVAARHPPQERVDASLFPSRRVRRLDGMVPRLGFRHARRPRPAEREQEHRNQAVRDFQRDDRPRQRRVERRRRRISASTPSTESRRT